MATNFGEGGVTLTRKEFLLTHPDLYRRYRTGRRMAVVGGVTMGVGLALALPALLTLALLRPLGESDTTSLEDTKDARDMVALAGVGGVAAAAGASAMAIGLVRRNRVLSEVDAERSRGPIVVAAPWVGPGSGGLTAVIAF